MVIEQGKSSQLLSFSTSDMVLGFVHLPLKKKKNFFNELIEHWPFLVSCAKWETIQFGRYSLWLLSEFVCFVTTHFRSSASHFSTKDILLPPPPTPLHLALLSEQCISLTKSIVVLQKRINTPVKHEAM